jgi:general secretion pathway protein G
VANRIRQTQCGFSLVEILIVVAIIGILAAIVLPEFQNHASEARETAARDNLRIIRKTIELYAIQHNGIAPGYPGNDPSADPDEATFKAQLQAGNYFSAFPANSFNGLATVQFVANGAAFPVAASGAFGWVYQPQTKNIRLDFVGNDSNNDSYFGY